MFASLHVTSFLIGACLALGVGLIVAAPFWRSEPDPQNNNAVDPWAMQAELMRISAQRMPTKPEISQHSLMYAALIMEEGSETFSALHTAMFYRNETHNLPVAQNIAQHLLEISTVMHSTSLAVRSLLEKMPEDFRIGLSLERAVEIFDGTTDIQVVNSGFALASGFPGAAGYQEVGGSNLSKRNPTTGVIDKTPDGKWIKGKDYRAPDLAKVLQLHCGRSTTGNNIKPLRAQA